MEQPMRKKQRRGFAAMSDETRRRIQQKGGQVAAQNYRDMKAKLAAIEALVQQEQHSREPQAA